jgi:predicted membrane protein
MACAMGCILSPLGGYFGESPKTWRISRDAETFGMKEAGLAAMLASVFLYGAGFGVLHGVGFGVLYGVGFGFMPKIFFWRP